MATKNKSAKPRTRAATPQKQKPFHVWHHHHPLLTWLLGIAGVVVLLVLAVAIASRVSPWPDSLLIRWAFNQGGTKTSKALEKHVPGGITEVENQQYRPNDKDGRLDVFYPQNTTGALPTVVWVHGGGWVSGDKDEIDNYLKILASYGFTTIGVDYTIAPEATYPKPLLQVNDALAYIRQHAARLRVDPDNLFLAGDSAGSQIVAQMATIITSPDYAREIGIRPEIPAGTLRGMLLNCGAYDLALADYNGPFGGFLRTVLWAYSGKKDFLNDPALRHASVANYVTKDFPPSFITAGNVDPLLPQSTEFAKKLQSLGVPTSTLFYAKDHQPELNHEYQFNLDVADGRKALERMVEFVRQYARQ